LTLHLTSFAIPSYVRHKVRAKLGIQAGSPNSERVFAGLAGLGLHRARKLLRLQAGRLYPVTMFPEEADPRVERVRYELRATGVSSEHANPLRSGIHTRGYLPHVKREAARYFVTFRRADSLPKEVLLKFQAQRAERLAKQITNLRYRP
jgi:hypothetical protein